MATMSLIAAAQITAIATAVLALFAIVTAVFAFLAFGKQSREVGLLLEQATREAGDRRRAQATRVFVSASLELTTRGEMDVRVRNTSEQPVYDLEVSWDGAAEPMRDVISGGGPCMPGEEYPPFFAGLEVAGTLPLVWLDFRDAAGLRWRTTSQGQLTGPQALETPRQP